MCNATDRPDPAGTPRQQERERVRSRLEALVHERDLAEQRRVQLTSEIHDLLRDAHEIGWSWSEIADFAGYSNADAARNQASRRRERPSDQTPPSGSYSVREAAELLGVTPQTVYSWVASGRLLAADDRKSNRRVYLPPDHASPSSPSS